MKRSILPYLALAAIVTLLVWWAHDYLLPGFTGLTNDDATYVASARDLARGKGYVLAWGTTPQPADRFPIGYPAMIAPFFWLPATLDQHVRWIQEYGILLAAGFFVAAFLYLHRFLRLPAWAGLTGVALVALSPFAAFNAGQILSDLAFGLVLMAALWQSHKALESPDKGRIVLAGVLSAAAILVRYAGAVLPVCLVLTLLVRKRYREALLYGATTGVLLLPWVAWVTHAKAFGYAQQIAHQAAASMELRLLSLAFSAALTFVQSVPSFFLPIPFLPGFPSRGSIPLDNVPLVITGLVLSGLFLAGLALSARSDRLRFPVSVVAAYFALVLVWQTGFLNLGEHLCIRLLMPVMPVAFALAAFGWGAALSERRPLRMIGAGALGACLVIAATQALLIHGQMVKVAMPGLKAERASYYGLIREFAKQVPETDKAATNTEPLFYLLTGRSCYSFVPNSRFLIQQIANTEVKYFLGVSTWVGGKDLHLEAVKEVNQQLPGSIYIIYNYKGNATGVYRVDRKAFDASLAKLRKPT